MVYGTARRKIIMFIELAIGVKAIVLIVALLGMFFNLFPEIDLFPKKPHEPAMVQAEPVVDNVWAALVYAPDDNARDDIHQTHKEEQITARQADTNATRVAMYQTHQVTVSEKLKSNNRLAVWALAGLCSIAFPLPKREKKKECELYEH